MTCDVVARATGYPYPVPIASYVFETDAVRSLDRPTFEALRGGRLPVLAAGSNRSPEQLARKFAATAGWGPILVTEGVLENFDSVYAAHLASYGAVPGTLFPSPGTALTLHINWLTERQAERMHETEVNSSHYTFQRLDDIRLTLTLGERLPAAFFYRAENGVLIMDDGPVVLGEIAARNRRWPAMTQRQILGRVRDLTAPGVPLETFIVQSATAAETRRQRSVVLARTARSFEPDGETPNR